VEKGVFANLVLEACVLIERHETAWILRGSTLVHRSTRFMSQNRARAKVHRAGDTTV